MERQTIVIQYVGERASDTVQSTAVLSFLNTLAHNGVYVDATIDPIAHHFSETDVAQVTAMVANKSKAKGVTIKVENTKKPVLSREDGERLINALKGLFE
jgi:hypothetical protein